MVARHAPGAEVKLTVIHDKQKRDVDVTLAPLEDEKESASQSQQGPSASDGERSSTLGIGVGEEDGHVVVQRVAPDGPSDGKLQAGDVIEEIGHQPVASASDLASKVQGGAVGRADPVEGAARGSVAVRRHCAKHAVGRNDRPPTPDRCSAGAVPPACPEH